jgi:hypothetical protein
MEAAQSPIPGSSHQFQTNPFPHQIINHPWPHQSKLLHPNLQFTNTDQPVHPSKPNPPYLHGKMKRKERRDSTVAAPTPTPLLPKPPYRRRHPCMAASPSPIHAVDSHKTTAATPPCQATASPCSCRRLSLCWKEMKK